MQNLPALLSALTCLGLAAPAGMAASEPLKVFISVDMEGVSNDSHGSHRNLLIEELHAPA